jgi:hypothetical protein
MRTLVGGCRCGHIRYEITEQPWFGFACHCTDCQQLTASAFSLGITVPESGFRLVQNRPQQWTKIGSSGRPSHQFTCPNCSGWTHTKPEVLTRQAAGGDHNRIDRFERYRDFDELFANLAHAVACACTWAATSGSGWMPTRNSISLS